MMYKLNIIFVTYLSILILVVNGEHDSLPDQEKLINRVSEGGWSDVMAGACQVAETGEVVHHGKNWWSDDRCTECHCKNGVLECQNSHCESCINPHYLPGHCCPVCHDFDIHLPHCTWIDGCNLKCKHGLRQDARGCFHCDCQRRDGEDCPLQCPNDRYAKDENGKDKCECDSTQVATQQETCSDGNTERKHGDEWSDGCRQCACSNGVIMCSLMACPRCPGATISIPGECCPRCNGSNSRSPEIGSSTCQSADGTVRQFGSRWRLDFACAWCECHHGGQVLCGAEKCPPAACANPVSVTGECCPRCLVAPHRPDDITAPPCPASRVEGEAWREDTCKSCLCLKGRTVCFHESCSPPACAFPITIRGRCCPICPNTSTAAEVKENQTTCVDGNSTRALGETWHRRGACVKCVCSEGGLVKCTPQKQCNNEEVPAQCCTACSADGAAVIDNSSHIYQICMIFLIIIVLIIIFGGLFFWCRRRGGFRIGAEHAWCCAADKVRSCRSPAVLTYNPVRLCNDGEQPANNDQRASFMVKS